MTDKAQKGRGLFILLAIAIVAFFVAYWSPAIYKEMGVLKLLPQPEPFTELYFSDYTTLAKNLPTHIVSGSTVSFSFTIHNVEGRNMSYPYTVYILSTLASSTATTTVAHGTAVLDDNASTTLQERYTFQHAVTAATFFILLPDQNQSLHFFVPNKN